MTLSRPVTEPSRRNPPALHLQGQGDSEEPPSEQARMSRADGSGDDPIRILVVEDNIPNQQVACAILERAGMAFEVVVDGKAAIEALEARPFDLVLMDCFMPVLDGFAATRAIRARDSKVLDRNVPIIAVTALAMEGDRQKCLQAGMDDYLSKPVNPRELVETIRRHLGKDSEQDPALATDGFREDVRPVSRGLDPEQLEPVLEMFLEEIPRQIDKIQAALADRDAEQLGIICHELRGFAGILGTTSISNMAFAIEAASRYGDTDRVVALTPKLLTEIQKLSTELRNSDLEQDQ